METLEAKKVRLLGRKLMAMFPWTPHAQAIRNATSLVSLLDEIEQAYYCQLEEANSQTHIDETYAN